MILVTADGQAIPLGRESLQTSGKRVPSDYAQKIRAAVAEKIQQSRETSNQDMNWSKLGTKVVGCEHTSS